tara:strand:+ start:1425 stop:1604 length:180 start_codon:yes stop_codon:yes gene_type:complete
MSSIDEAFVARECLERASLSSELSLLVPLPDAEACPSASGASEEAEDAKSSDAVAMLAH